MGESKMKRKAHRVRTTLTSIAIMSCAAPFSFAQDRVIPVASTASASSRNLTPATSADLATGVFIASRDAEKYSLRHYDGQKLLNTEGAELGTIRDLIVHPPSSRVRYLVVSSGGVLGGIGNSLRLVPVEAVRHRTQDNRLAVDILQSAWLQVPPISDENYVVDRFDISDVQHEAMVQRFGSTSPPSGPVNSVAPSRSAQAANSGLVRGSVLCRKKVSVADQNIGEIENIIVDLERGTAAALFDSSGPFTGTKAKYIIPLNRLVFGPTARDPFGLTLTRDDFDRAQIANFGSVEMAAAHPRAAAEPALTPTGRTTSDASLNAASDVLMASARSVRRAIDADPVLAAERVQVTAENGKVVLSGSVRTAALRENLEQTARRALSAGNIENRVKVEHP